MASESELTSPKDMISFSSVNWRTLSETSSLGRLERRESVIMSQGPHCSAMLTMMSPPVPWSIVIIRSMTSSSNRRYRRLGLGSTICPPPRVSSAERITKKSPFTTGSGLVSNIWTQPSSPAVNRSASRSLTLAGDSLVNR